MQIPRLLEFGVLRRIPLSALDLLCLAVTVQTPAPARYLMVCDRGQYVYCPGPHLTGRYLRYIVDFEDLLEPTILRLAAYPPVKIYRANP